MKEKERKTVKRTVKLTVRVYDGEEPEQRDFPADEYPDDDPFASFSYPIEDVEDAVLRFVEERDAAFSSGDAELVTVGEFSSDGDEINIGFSDPFEEEDGGVVTVINFRASEPGIVSVLKTGSVGSVFVLEEGKTHVSVFETPAGSAEARVFARKVVNSVSPVSGRGELRLDYTVTLPGSMPIRSVMTVKAE
ncbi:MAG: DUF1934 domain-containing protein [Clostridia bacterium]|nr:DUF1934 domain-containing protein [Clostridia bacterium]